MSSETFVEADVWTIAQTDQGNVVLLRPKGSDLAVPIIIGQLETQSILIGMGGVEVPRPLTHDLIAALIEALSGLLLRIEINELKEGTFYARLIIRQEEEDIIVDARPSDAIGVAVRTGCPVYISEAIVDEAGISVNLVTEAGRSLEEEMGNTSVGDGHSPPANSTASPTASPMAPGDAGAAEGGTSNEESARLEEELEAAIAIEDYERAAFLRDRLRELGGA